MSDDKIAEIKERHFHDERWRNGPSMLCPQMHDDRAFLLAEDARHRAEIERLRTEALELARGLGKADAKVALLSRDYDDARAEVERHRAEIERLCNEDTKTRHALGGWVWVCPDGGDEPTHERVAAVVAEVEKLRAENDELYKAAGRTRAALSGWILASPGREDEPTHELVAAVVAEAERLRFQRSLRKLRDKP